MNSTPRELSPWSTQLSGHSVQQRVEGAGRFGFGEFDDDAPGAVRGLGAGGELGLLATSGGAGQFALGGFVGEPGVCAPRSRPGEWGCPGACDVGRGRVSFQR